jgi:hypothetical protein
LVLTLARGFSVFALTLIDFARRLTLLVGGSFFIQCQNKKVRLLLSLPAVLQKSAPCRTPAISECSTRWAAAMIPASINFSLRILPDPFTLLFEKTFHGRAGAHRLRPLNRGRPNPMELMIWPTNMGGLGCEVTDEQTAQIDSIPWRAFTVKGTTPSNLSNNSSSTRDSCSRRIFQARHFIEQPLGEGFFSTGPALDQWL